MTKIQDKTHLQLTKLASLDDSTKGDANSVQSGTDSVLSDAAFADPDTFSINSRLDTPQHQQSLTAPMAHKESYLKNASRGVRLC